jgi:hypothetical protein
MIDLNELREKARVNPRGRAVVGLLPLTFIMVWVMIHGFTDQTGPHHGMILKLLAVGGLIAVGLLWLGVLKLPKSE